MTIETELEQILRRKQEQLRELTMREGDLKGSVSSLEKSFNEALTKERALKDEIVKLENRKKTIKAEIDDAFKSRESSLIDQSEDILEKKDALSKKESSLVAHESELKRREGILEAKKDQIRTKASELKGTLLQIIESWIKEV